MGTMYLFIYFTVLLFIFKFSNFNVVRNPLQNKTKLHVSVPSFAFYSTVKLTFFYNVYTWDSFTSYSSLFHTYVVLPQWQQFLEADIQYFSYPRLCKLIWFLDV